MASVSDVLQIAKEAGLEVRGHYSIREAARILGVGRETLRRAVHKGKVRATRVGRAVYISVAELARLLEEGDLV